MVIPSPAWAANLPQSAPGRRVRRDKRPAMAPRPVRLKMSVIAPVTNHVPRNIPIGPRADLPVCIAQTSANTAIERTRAGTNCFTARPILARFHGSMAPIGSTKASATMKGVKAASKNGAPTDILRSNASPTKGQIVPTNTTKDDTAKRMLFTTSALSRLTIPKTPLASIAPARAANNVSAPPVKNSRMNRMNTPRSGSDAKAWTEVITPDRTINVPISEKPKARIASRMVQLFRLSRFSTTMAECRSAAANNHGMKDAFSTGSQNQKPPQPSS